MPHPITLARRLRRSSLIALFLLVSRAAHPGGAAAQSDSTADSTATDPVAADTLQQGQDSLQRIQDSLRQIQDSVDVRNTALLARADSLTADVSAMWAEIESLLVQYSVSEGDERLVVDGQIERRAAAVRPRLGQLTSVILEMEDAGLDATGPRTTTVIILDDARNMVRDELDAIGARILDMRANRDTVPADRLLSFERDLAQAGREYDENLIALINIADLKTALEVDATADYAYLDPLLRQRSDRLTGEIDVTLRVVAGLGDRLNDVTDEVEAASIRLESAAAQERLNAATTSLTSIVAGMDRRAIDAAEQKQLLIRATGRVTTDVLNITVATGLLQQAWDSITNWIAANAPQMVFNFLIFVLIVFVFRLLARLTRKVVTTAVHRDDTRVPALLKQMVATLSANLVFLLGILIGLSQLGIHVGPVLAGLGVAGFIVGFALQDSLSNFASGMMILIYRPFDVGDVIEAAGVAGTVKNLTLVSTTILTFDHERLIVPNRQVWSNVIRNKTAEPIRRVDLTFEIGDRSQTAQAEVSFRTVLNAHPLVLEDPPPQIDVNDLTDSAVHFLVRPWVNTEDYWTVYWEVSRLITDQLEADGIARPYLRREVEVTNAGAGTA
jgi:small conductance mechanosensitive channel